MKISKEELKSIANRIEELQFSSNYLRSCGNNTMKDLFYHVETFGKKFPRKYYGMTCNEVADGKEMELYSLYDLQIELAVNPKPKTIEDLRQKNYRMYEFFLRGKLRTGQTFKNFVESYY